MDEIETYLRQIGELPLLSREEEIAVARRMEWSRARWRRAVLSSDYVLQAVAGLLGRACQGGRTLRNTVGLALNSAADRQRALGLLVPNVQTLQGLLRKNSRDFQVVLRADQPAQTPQGVAAASPPAPQGRAPRGRSAPAGRLPAACLRGAFPHLPAHG